MKFRLLQNFGDFSLSSIRKSRLYLAVLSERQTDPVLICPPPIATDKSEMKVSSVSPDL